MKKPILITALLLLVGLSAYLISQTARGKGNIEIKLTNEYGVLLPCMDITIISTDNSIIEE
jgi:uncharacterized protein YxeA